tara:strand:+ start:780 stop:1085 length:306 start_codon:yes stop_codon:yes gene_type:complete
MKKFYIILAIAGTLLPYWAMFSSILFDQYSVSQFFSAWFENNAVKMIVADLGVAGTTFSVYIIYSFKMERGPHPLKYFLMMFGVGLSLAMPMYFLKKEIDK